MVMSSAQNFLTSIIQESRVKRWRSGTQTRPPESESSRGSEVHTGPKGQDAQKIGLRSFRSLSCTPSHRILGRQTLSHFQASSVLTSQIRTRKERDSPMLYVVSLRVGKRSYILMIFQSGSKPDVVGTCPRFRSSILPMWLKCPIMSLITVFWYAEPPLDHLAFWLPDLLAYQTGSSSRHLLDPTIDLEENLQYHLPIHHSRATVRFRVPRFCKLR